MKRFSLILLASLCFLTLLFGVFTPASAAPKTHASKGVVTVYWRDRNNQDIGTQSFQDPSGCMRLTSPRGAAGGFLENSTAGVMVAFGQSNCSGNRAVASPWQITGYQSWVLQSFRAPSSS